MAFGEHRLMLRPRESFDLLLLESRLEISPDPTEVRWVQDVFGNAVTFAKFGTRASELVFTSTARVDHNPLGRDDVHVEDYAWLFPFTYSSEDMPDLLRSIERQHHDPYRKLDSWARRFISDDGHTETLAMLVAMTERIRRDFTYVPRHEKGTQTPIETLEKQQGTCRDFAVLMIEAARALGLAARFVSGYVYDPSRRDRRTGGGNTHAWLRIFLPGSGWVEFDPTNGIVGSEGLIRVAIARDPAQAVPLSGTWSGFPSSSMGMDVTVSLHVEDPVSSGQSTQLRPAFAG